jgi:integrase
MRRRFQKGNVIIRGKTPQRYGMYREDVLQSVGTFKRVRRCVLLGPVSKLSERAAVKSNASSADVPMPSQLGTRLRVFLRTHGGKSDLLFVNRRGRPFSANKLREHVLQPLLLRLGIAKGGFHSLRHGAASALIADGATPAVVQKQLRHSDARITLGVYAHVIGNQQRDAVENRSVRIEKYAMK